MGVSSSSPDNTTDNRRFLDILKVERNISFRQVQRNYWNNTWSSNPSDVTLGKNVKIKKLNLRMLLLFVYVSSINDVDNGTFSKITLPKMRSFMWSKGREDKEGELKEDNVKLIADKLMESEQQIKDGKVILEPGTDAMSLVFGQEKGRFLKGVGTGVTATRYFHVPRNKGTTKQEVKDLKCAVQTKDIELEKKDIELEKKNAEVKSLSTKVDEQVLITIVKSVTKGDVKHKIIYIANGTLAKRTRNSTLNKLKE
ncbi:hypothetical protein LXL04_016308 [Taraxacum kok-saghyz]